MLLGMSLQTFTVVHVVLSLVGIASGIGVVLGMLAGRRLDGWTGLFLGTTVLTTVTGFMFPIKGFTPALGTGIVSSIALAVTLFALYGKGATGGWRRVYVIGAVASLWLNSFVAVVQTFLKIPFAHALAPTQQEPPFLVAQAVVLLAHVVVGYFAVKRFRPAPTAAVAPAYT